MKSSDYKLVILSEARDVVRLQSQHIAAQGNPQNAKRWKRRFFNQLRALANFPLKFPIYADENGIPTPYRKVTILGYSVYYTIEKEDKTVVVVLIKPGALEK